MKQVNKNNANGMNMLGGKTDRSRDNLSSYQKTKGKIKYGGGKSLSNKVLIVVAIVLILITLTILFVFCSDYFMLKRVKINGMLRSNSFDILSQAGIEQDKNIFLLSRDDIKSNIERDPLLIVQSVSLEPPDMLSITIEEREVIAIVEHDQSWVEITKDGYIITKDRIYNYNLPYLKGFEIKLDHIKVQNDYTLYIINVLANFYENNSDVFDMISEIDVSGKDLVMYTRGYNTKVLLPRYATARKLVDLAAIVTLLKASGEEVVQIDFRFDNAVLKYKE